MPIADCPSGALGIVRVGIRVEETLELGVGGSRVSNFCEMLWTDPDSDNSTFWANVILDASIPGT